MKKKTRLMIIIPILALLLVGGIFGGVKIHQAQVRQAQIDFLKSHEKEMTDFVMSQNKTQSPEHRIKSVQWDWSSIQVETVQPNAGGIPTGDSFKQINIQGGFNHIKDSNFQITIDVDDKSNMPVFHENSPLMSDDGFYIGGDIYE